MDLVWLTTAADLSQHAEFPTPNTAALLTDGEPNSGCSGLPELLAYKDRHPEFDFSVNTFCFGYNLDSALMHSLATEGNGTMAFIPDA